MPFHNRKIPETPMPAWEKVDQILIKDNGEKLLPTSLSSKIIHYPVYYKMGIKEAIPECLVRETVFEKLLSAIKYLPPNIHLVILDGWRPYLVQKYLYDTWVSKIEKNQAIRSASQIRQKARQFVSPPYKTRSKPSPHLTGGAVDVTLCNSDGRLLDMGGKFDEPVKIASSAALECSTLGKTYDTARRNRRILYYAMTSVGFTNLPSEWWHFDYGDQLWAYYHRSDTAFYSLIQNGRISVMP
ncbi:MAG: M15 family metallopeptidase [Ostreibacterium sp.]